MIIFHVSFVLISLRGGGGVAGKREGLVPIAPSHLLGFIGLAHGALLLELDRSHCMEYKREKHKMDFGYTM